VKVEFGSAPPFDQVTPSDEYLDAVDEPERVKYIINIH